MPGLKGNNPFFLIKVLELKYMKDKILNTRSSSPKVQNIHE